ncbi:MAG TPA: hypothetical protein VE222_08100 [Nitrospiraceae bacterium]|nr:hypothetical protein [Nitrospiraceae bacterium]
MKRIAFTLTLIAAMCVCAVGTISAQVKEDEKAIRFRFQTVIFPGDTFTQLLGINDFQVIAGYHGSGADAQHPNKGFTLVLPDDFISENFPNSAQTQVIGINNRRFTDGFFIDVAGITHGFLDLDGAFTAVDFPGTTMNQLLGLNNFDQAAGFFADAAGIAHAYIFDNNGGVFFVLTIPVATGGAQATGINDKGSISGIFIDNAGKTHGFLIAKGEFIVLDFPGAISTSAFGLNNEDDVVGDFMDAAGRTHGFIFDDREFQQVDDPQGVGTTIINGINNRGDIVGFFVDAKGNTDGFVATSQGERERK